MMYNVELPPENLQEGEWYRLDMIDGKFVVSKHSDDEMTEMERVLAKFFLSKAGVRPMTEGDWEALQKWAEKHAR